MPGLSFTFPFCTVLLCYGSTDLRGSMDRVAFHRDMAAFASAVASVRGVRCGRPADDLRRSIYGGKKKRLYASFADGFSAASFQLRHRYNGRLHHASLMEKKP